MKRKRDKLREVESENTYWDWVQKQHGEEASAESARANPDVLPAPEKEEPSGEKVLRLRAIREANLTPHETLVVNLLLTMTQEQAARHLGITRGAITGALKRAQEKIERKLATLRARDLADNEPT